MLFVSSPWWPYETSGIGQYTLSDVGYDITSGMVVDMVWRPFREDFVLV